MVGRLGILLDRWDCRFAVSNLTVQILLKLSFRYTVNIYSLKKEKKNQSTLPYLQFSLKKKHLSTMTGILLSK